MAETTSLAQVQFQVDREPDGRPFILIDETHSPPLSILRHGYLRLDLDPGVTPREAEELAARLNRQVHALIYVGEDPDEAGH